MSKVHVDLETFSELDVRKVGVHRYAHHPSTLILCASYCVDDGDIKTIRSDRSLKPLLAALKRHRQVRAFNVQFERVILQALFPELLEVAISWECVAAKAAMHSLPRSLAKCALELKFPAAFQKDEAGKRTMTRLSKPDKTKGRLLPIDYPAEYEQLYAYNVQDVVVERKIDQTLPDLPLFERRVFELDQLVNDRGILADRPLVDLVLTRWSDHLRIVNDRCIELTGVKATQVGELGKLLGMDDLTKDSIREALRTAQEPEREILGLRQEASKTSVSKFKAMRDSMGDDDRLRGMFLYFGASPGRWAGLRVQLHNLPRNTAEDPEAVIELLKAGRVSGNLVQQLIRPSLIPAPGHEFLVGDFAGVEFRLTMWATRCAVALRVIRSGLDLYKTTAVDVYDIPYERIDASQRFLGKQAVLGLGFGMGAPRFVAACESYGVEISSELSQRTVNVYRQKYAEVVNGWYDVESSAIRAVNQPGVSVPALNGLVRYLHKPRSRFLYCFLPSGRPISYPFPKVKPDENARMYKDRSKLHHMTTDARTHQRIEYCTWGGTLFENIIQGIARDLLAEAMFRVEAAGMRVVGHVHDEIIVEAPKGRYTVDDLEHTMSECPSWAEGLPLAVEGFSTNRYRK